MPLGRASISGPDRRAARRSRSCSSSATCCARPTRPASSTATSSSTTSSSATTPFADGRRVKLLDWGVAYVEGEDGSVPRPDRRHADLRRARADSRRRAHAVPPTSTRSPCSPITCSAAARRSPPRTTSRSSTCTCAPSRRAPRIAWPDDPRPRSTRCSLRMLAKQPEDRPTLDEVERVLRKMLDSSRAGPRRLSPRGSQTALPVAAALPADVLGRPRCCRTRR